MISNFVVTKLTSATLGNDEYAYAFDHIGNRATTLHHRYIYRGYLQIAALDLTRSAHPALWLVTWDPTQPTATRPLAIQKDGTWFTYGYDITKNICEVFGPAGYIRTAYSYAPFGSVSESGDVTQPFQWSSEYYDSELDLVYYNYRHYSPSLGRFLSRDPIEEQGGLNLYAFVKNKVDGVFDWKGLFLWPWETHDLDIDDKWHTDISNYILKKDDLAIIPFDSVVFNISVKCKNECYLDERSVRRKTWNFSSVEVDIIINIYLRSEQWYEAHGFKNKIAKIKSNEEEHLQDYISWSNGTGINLLKEKANPSKFSDFNSESRCVSEVRNEILTSLRISLHNAFIDSERKYDLSGLHTIYKD